MIEQFNTSEEALWASQAADSQRSSSFTWTHPWGSPKTSYTFFPQTLVARMSEMGVDAQFNYSGPMDLIIAPPGWIYSRQEMVTSRTVIFTMTETTAFPPEVLPVFKKARAIVVPTALGAACLSAQLRVQTFVCHLGADERELRPTESLRVNSQTIFSCIADANTGFRRKGLEILIAAFKEEFGESKDYELRLRVSPSPRRPVVDAPNIVYYDSHLPADEKRRFIADSDFGIFPSYGEGFGLVPVEYTMMGKLVAVTDNTAMVETNPHAFRIPSRIVPCFGDYSHGSWFEPAQSGVRAVMREMMALTKEEKEMRVSAGLGNFFRKDLTMTGAAKRLLGIMSQVGILN